MAERRRLPVLNSPPPPSKQEEDEEPRPPWHWIGFGTVAIFAAWLPLAYLAGSISQRIMAGRFGHDASKDAIDLALQTMTAGERARLMFTVAMPTMAALAIAAFGGGFVVGRWGSGVREAALSGFATAIIASLMAWQGPTAASFIAAACTMAIAVGFAAWGGRFGRSKRGNS